MNRIKTLFIGIMGLVLVPIASNAQEEQEINVEQSAEVFLEEYSDDFQENFFAIAKV